MAIATSKALRDIRATDQKDCSSYCGKDDCTGTVRYTVDFGCTPKEGVVIGHYKIENIMCHCTEKKE